MAHRLGKVSYINSLPLFCAGSVDGFEIVPEHPARLNALVGEGALDVSLISRWAYSGEIAKNYRVLPQYCIASDGDVMSVKIFSKCALSELAGKKIFITPETGTSSRAFRHVIRKLHGIDIFALERAEIKDADAVLLIGNRALAFDPSPYAYLYDLGEMWRETYKMPMIYAVFAARNDAYDAVAGPLSAYLDESLELFRKKRSDFLLRAQRDFLAYSGMDIGMETLDRYYNCLIYKLGRGDFEKSFNFVSEHGKEDF